MTLVKSSLLHLLLGACLFAAGVPAALASGDQERARAALEAGQVLPLRTVLERLEREHPGQVLEVELEQEKGRWIYEVKMLRAGGRLAKIKVDARTGDLVSQQERR